MIRLITIALTILLSASGAWGATYNIGPGQTYETFAALVAAQTLAGDDIVDGGGNTFYETWTPNGSGTAGHVVTLRNATIDGSEDIKGATGDWTYSATYGCWQRTVSGSPLYAQMWLNDLPGTKVTRATMAAADVGSWSQVTTTAYLQTGGSSSDKNPATFFTTIRGSKLTKGIDISRLSYITVSNVEIRKIQSVSGISWAAMAGGVVVNNAADHITVEDSTFTDNLNSLFSDNSTNVTFDNNTISRTYASNAIADYGVGGKGSAVLFSSDSTSITNNVIDNHYTLYVGNAEITYAGHGIRALITDDATGNRAASLTISGNTISNHYDYGINVHANDIGTSAITVDGTITQNTLSLGRPVGGVDDDPLSCGDSYTGDAAKYATGLTFSRNRVIGNGGNDCGHTANRWRDVKWISNIMTGCATATAGWGGIKIGGYDKAYNNTIYNCYRSGIYASAITADIQNNIISTISKRTGGTYGTGIEGGSGGASSHNLIYNAAGGVASAGWTDTATITSDPLLDSDLRPTANSPALWQRASIPGYDTSYEGLFYGHRGAPIGALTQGAPRSHNTAPIR